jgi:hypothetical protein
MSEELIFRTEGIREERYYCRSELNPDILILMNIDKYINISSYWGRDDNGDVQCNELHGPINHYYLWFGKPCNISEDDTFSKMNRRVEFDIGNLQSYKEARKELIDSLCKYEDGPELVMVYGTKKVLKFDLEKI